MAARRAARALPGALFAALAALALLSGAAEARGPSGRAAGPRGWAADADAMPRDVREPRGTILAQPGQVTPDKVERWRRLPPEERERLRDRYRQWKSLPPERRERFMERSRRWRELPEDDRRFLRQRREMYRNAWPEERRTIDKFFVRWRQLPPERRDALRRRIAEWRALPASERDERMMDWPFYGRLQPDEQRVIRWYLFSEPPPPRPRRD